MGLHREIRRLRRLGTKEFVSYHFGASQKRRAPVSVQTAASNCIDNHERRPAAPSHNHAPEVILNAAVPPPVFDRKVVILEKIDRRMKILEIGPSYNPAAPKCEGWNVLSLDHASQEELRRKYEGPDYIDISRIEPVDFIYRDGPLHASIPSHLHGTFDAVIASHVIEHIPDPISFFDSLKILLREGGLVSLAIPDKRFIFDFFRPLTTTGEWLDAFDKKRTRHTKGALFDAAAHNVTLNGLIAWGATNFGEIAPCPPGFAGAKPTFDSTSEDPRAPYIDTHAWRFTPSSFALLVTDLRYLDLLPFEIETSRETVGCEFFVTLRQMSGLAPKPENIDAVRLTLMRQAMLEIGEQVDFLKKMR